MKVVSKIVWKDATKIMPPIDKEVLVYCDDGYVGRACVSLSAIKERSKITGLFEPTNNKELKWGQQHNGWEYWDELNNVLLWSHYPDEVEITRQLKEGLNEEQPQRQVRPLNKVKVKNNEAS
jgi:hypothetical protein